MKPEHLVICQFNNILAEIYGIGLSIYTKNNLKQLMFKNVHI